MPQPAERPRAGWFQGEGITTYENESTARYLGSSAWSRYCNQRRYGTRRGGSIVAGPRTATATATTRAGLLEEQDLPTRYARRQERPYAQPGPQQEEALQKGRRQQSIRGWLPEGPQLMRTTVISGAVLTTLLLACSAMARDHSSLNGTCTLVPARSDFAGQPVVQTGTVTINDHQGIITVSRNFVYKGTTETFYYSDM